MSTASVETAAPASSGTTTPAATVSPASNKVDAANSDFLSSKFPIDDSIDEDERRFYHKAYPTVDLVTTRRVHCTVCRAHIGTAAIADANIKMHPVLRVTHCIKCHDFYNSGEFSKGEDGSELYCRWCGQGGEVYCCSSCPYVFCKSCIVKNLSRGVVADIEQNENWNCFNCTPKILWPLRAQHWALTNYIKTQRKLIEAQNLSENEYRIQMIKDSSQCCRLTKSKQNNLSDSLESIESNMSKRSANSAIRRTRKSPQPGLPAKRLKSGTASNDEVVCTPDLLSILEPDCQLTVAQQQQQKSGAQRVAMPSPSTASAPKVMTIPTNYSTPKSSVPPPLVFSNTNLKVRPVQAPSQQGTSSSILRRTVVGATNSPPGTQQITATTAGPVYHTIGGYRIDLNTASRHNTFRLPNGKLIQVKRQQPPAQGQQGSNSQVLVRHGQFVNRSENSGQTSSTAISRTVSQISQNNSYGTLTIRQGQPSQSNPTGQSDSHGRANNNQATTSLQSNQHVLNGTTVPPAATVAAVYGQAGSSSGAAQRQGMVRCIFPATPIGKARTQLQDQIFSAVEICAHLSGKLQTLTNSNAYKQARNYLDVKELYIHLSYLVTYGLGRLNGLQDSCLDDMRQLGFSTDADSLQNGQLAADKQASDDEDNEIEIVEPTRDTITIDSDDDEEEHPLNDSKNNISRDLLAEALSTEDGTSSTTATTATTSITVTSRTKTSPAKASTTTTSITTLAATSKNISSETAKRVTRTKSKSLPPESDVNAFTSNNSTDVDLDDCDMQPVQKKQPRKKTTSKPNPALLQLERERLEGGKKANTKLKQSIVICLTRVEDIYPSVKKMLAKLSKAQKNNEIPETKSCSADKEIDESIETTTVSMSPHKEQVPHDKASSTTQVSEMQSKIEKGEQNTEELQISLSSAAHSQSLESQEIISGCSKESQNKEAGSKTPLPETVEKQHSSESSKSTQKPGVQKHTEASANNETVKDITGEDKKIQESKTPTAVDPKAVVDLKVDKQSKAAGAQEKVEAVDPKAVVDLKVDKQSKAEGAQEMVEAKKATSSNAKSTTTVGSLRDLVVKSTSSKTKQTMPIKQSNSELQKCEACKKKPSANINKTTGVCDLCVKATCSTHYVRACQSCYHRYFSNGVEEAAVKPGGIVEEKKNSPTAGAHDDLNDAKKILADDKQSEAELIVSEKKATETQTHSATNLIERKLYRRMPAIKVNNDRRECQTCKKAPNRKDGNKTKAVCDFCVRPTCSMHFVRTCEECYHEKGRYVTAEKECNKEQVVDVATDQVSVPSTSSAALL